MPKVKSFNQDKAILSAQKLFWEKGYSATSINDLVTGLKISRSSIYDTYTDKYNLYLDTLRVYAVSKLNKFADDIKQASKPIEVIESLIKNINTSGKTKGCYIVQANAEFGNSDIEISKITSEYQQAYEKLILKALEAAKDKRQISKKVDSKEASKFMYAIQTSLNLYARAGRSSKGLAETALGMLK